jgi:hypothetical protein
MPNLKPKLPFRKLRHLLSTLVIAGLFGLACAAPALPLVARPTPGQVEVGVTVVYAGGTATPAPAALLPESAAESRPRLLFGLNLTRMLGNLPLIGNFFGPIPVAGEIQPTPAVSLPPVSPEVAETIQPLVDTTPRPVPFATDTAIPPPPETVTPAATFTPFSPPPTLALSTPTAVTGQAFTAPGQGQNFGVINLLGPDQDFSYPASVGGTEFKWQWSGSCALPQNHGFQIRIHAAMTGTVPLGVMDVTKEQQYIGCGGDGIYSFTVNNLKGAPGVKQTHIGKFLWDVAYIQLDPYLELTTSGPRLFEITLAYDGPIDPFGPDLACPDFPSWAEAQAVFLLAKKLGPDYHGLDPDGNGTACEELR